MIRLDYEPKLLRHVRQLLEASRANQQVLAESCQRILWEGNRRERIQGNGPEGSKLPALRSPRLGPYAGQTGKPLAPSEASRSITAFTSEQVKTRDGWTVTAGYAGPGVEILAYHAEGRSGAGKPLTKDGKLIGFRGIKGRVSGIVRNVFYVSKQTKQELADEFRAHSQATFLGKIRRAVGQFRREHYRMFGVFRAQGRG